MEKDHSPPSPAQPTSTPGSATSSLLVLKYLDSYSHFTGPQKQPCLYTTPRMMQLQLTWRDEICQKSATQLAEASKDVPEWSIPPGQGKSQRSRLSSLLRCRTFNDVYANSFAYFKYKSTIHYKYDLIAFSFFELSRKIVVVRSATVQKSRSTSSLES